jgi:hypothetical protein
MATDMIQNLESSLSEILGINPLSVRVAELALNYGKGTIQSWFQYLHEDAGLFELRICTNRPYAMVMNGNSSFETK